MARYVYPFSANTSYAQSHWDGLNAVDVFGDSGSAIVACTDGWATVATYSLGGHTVTLRGDDGRHYYHAHLVDGTGVSGRVSMGQTIGKMDNTGNAAGRPTHCHWAVGSASYGIDSNGAGDVPPWPLLNQWKHSPFPADEGRQGVEIAELETQIAQLQEFIARERSWGSAVVVHVILPSIGLLDEALAANPVDAAKINRVRELLAANGGQP
jgi:murein DD-endopeptidase MepM/ murein hydrolase activator NlpD